MFFFRNVDLGPSNTIHMCSESSYGSWAWLHIIKRNWFNPIARRIVDDFFIAIHPEVVDSCTGVRWCDLSTQLSIQLYSGEITQFHYLPVILKPNEINAEINNYGIEWKNIVTVSGETISVLALPDNYDEKDNAMWSFTVRSYIVLQLSSPTIIPSFIFDCISVQ